MQHVRGLARLLVLLALVGGLALALLYVPAVQGQARDGRLVELVTRLTFSEALDSMWHGHPVDAAMIWQATEGHSDTVTGRLAWLSRHSPCISGRLSEARMLQRRGNCIWARGLSPSTQLPRGWPWAPGIWTHNLQPRWRAHIARVRDLVRGRDTWRPCQETPHTWEGVQYERDTVEARGVRVLDCEPPYTSDPDVQGLHNFAVRWDEWS